MYEVRVVTITNKIHKPTYIKPFKVLSFKRYIPNITTPIYPRKARAIAPYLYTIQ